MNMIDATREQDADHRFAPVGRVPITDNAQSHFRRQGLRDLVRLLDNKPRDRAERAVLEGEYPDR